MEWLIYLLLWIVPPILNGFIMYYIVYYSYNLYDDYDRNKLTVGISFVPVFGLVAFIGLFIILIMDLFNRTFDKIYKKE